MKIGLEIHVQLKTERKLFCDCKTNYLEVPENENICEICTGQPGAKPSAVNKQALKNALKISLALGCAPKKEVTFLRKHYFWPDLPSGYQRTSTPIATNGKLSGITIREVHMEEDPGRYDLKEGVVDYNRSGIPLIEIVTEPEIKSPEHAKEFLEELSAILNYLNSSREEPGSTRIDANISINDTRVEIKNINSFSGVYSALSYEFFRQKDLISKGKKIERETRHYDEKTEKTFPLRKKEYEEDYRYIPDPDIPVLKISEEMIKEIEKEIPELPNKRMERIINEYKIREREAKIIVSEIEIADIFEKIAKKFDPIKVSYWIVGPLKKQLNYRNLKLKNSNLKYEDLISIFEDFYNKRITEDGMENALIKILDEGKKYEEIKSEFFVIEDFEKIKNTIDEVLKENENAVKDYKSGNLKAINFLIGTAMKKLSGKVDSNLIRKIILEKIEKVEK
ncbi:MAG: Asp-tRNA(Asn)/Glu-tRNA(Gln) amidotransferase subunit GatB [Candidatus Micrarchaeia archaeon]